MTSSSETAAALVGALVALGVRDVVLCPGSRSAPLAYALAARADTGDLRLTVRLDERTAGFTALGAALASGVPAAVVTTSGTAVANLHPAVLEADAAGVPLLVISADRPHRLRGIGANQVTDQVKLFGAAMRWFGELPAGADTPAARQAVSRAVAAAGGIDPGPVQLNVALDEPLVPSGPPGPEPGPEPGPGERGLTRPEAVAEPVPVRIGAGPRTVVLAGAGAGATPLVVARAAGWPLLAEPSSGARMEDAVGPYRLLLDDAALGGRVERVLLYGRPTLSRAVTRLIGRDDVEVVAVSPRPSWADPSGRAARVVAAVDPPLAGTGPGSAADAEWLDAWLSAGSAAAAAIDEVLDQELAAGAVTGPAVARAVAAATGPGDVLVAGSSNPIRDLDLVGGALPGSVRWVAGRRVVVEGAARVLANRGLSGIDGTVSTALGVARASSGARVRALLGDLTLLHDAGGLLSGVHEEVPQLQLVVVDDAGGGIFGLLEHGAAALAGPAENARYERFFATPQRVDLAALCAGYRVRHQQVEDAAGLGAALSDPPSGLSVLAVRVDRGAERDRADRLAAAVRTVLRP